MPTEINNVKESFSFMDFLLLEQNDMHVRNAIDQLKKDGKEITIKSLADLLDVPESTIKRGAKPLVVTFPELSNLFPVTAKRFNKD